MVLLARAFEDLSIHNVPQHTKDTRGIKLDLVQHYFQKVVNRT